MASGEQANHFVLACDDTEVSYAATSVTGSPLFSHTGPRGERQFSGEEIDRQETALGTEVTGTLEIVPDLHTVTVTLIVPNVRLDGSGPESISTFLVITTNRTTIAGPPVGAEQQYEIVPLDGEASFVVS